MSTVRRRFGRFSAVGVVGAGVQLLLLSLLTKCFGLLSVVATPIAVEIALLHNFILHERFTWSARGTRSLGEIAGRLWRFHAANGLISLAGNTILMYSLVERLKIPAMLAAVGAILLCSAANFLVADRWVFAPRIGADYNRTQAQLDNAFGVGKNKHLLQIGSKITLIRKKD